jgi:F0F1-type ATP synthase epsilon subunit
MAGPAPTMHVKIYAPFKTYFDADATSISAINRTGQFDVLAHHKNFMTLLIPCNIVVRTDGKPNFTMPIQRGIMHVKADRTTVFLDV